MTEFTGPYYADLGSWTKYSWSSFRALRPHHWVKNFFIFVPWLVNGELMDFRGFYHCLMAFVTFCALASSTYLINDLLDLESDRLHLHKRARPLAAGELPASWGLTLALALLSVGLLLSLALPDGFLFASVAYYIVATGYSLVFKRIPLLDVFILGQLYTIRIIAGYEATGIPDSLGILTAALFFFLSLALVKRLSELLATQDTGSVEANFRCRKYRVRDKGLVLLLGLASAQLAAILLGFHLTAAIGMIAAFWLNRIWWLAARARLHYDPIVFVLRDGTSYVAGGAILCLIIISGNP